MSRGQLSKADLKRIAEKFPDLKSVQTRILQLDSSAIATARKLPHSSTVPIAADCLEISCDITWEAGYALHEFYAHQIWYRERIKPPNEHAAILFERYYADDAIIRICAAVDYILESVTKMLDVKADELRKFKKVKSAQQERIILYLQSEAPHFIALPQLMNLIRMPVWAQAINYRNRWFHNQPPLMEGTGFKRQKKDKWKYFPDEGRYVLTLKYGDKPEVSTQGLISIAEPLYRELIVTLAAVTDAYYTVLEQLEIEITQKGISPNRTKLGG